MSRVEQIFLPYIEVRIFPCCSFESCCLWALHCTSSAMAQSKRNLHQKVLRRWPQQTVHKCRALDQFCRYDSHSPVEVRWHLCRLYRVYNCSAEILTHSCLRSDNKKKKMSRRLFSSKTWCCEIETTTTTTLYCSPLWTERRAIAFFLLISLFLSGLFWRWRRQRWRKHIRFSRFSPWT